MAVTFVAAGSIGANNTTASFDIVGPACNDGDILVASIFGRNVQVVTAPAGWTLVFQQNNGAGTLRHSCFWKRAGSGDSGATFAFTKPVDDNLLNCGVISAWRGCVASGSPIDATTPSVSLNSTASDTLTYADFDPTSTPVHVVAVSNYNTNNTTAGAIAGTNPAYTNRYDTETATGGTASLFGYSGDSDGSATGARSHSTTSTTDSGSMGFQFGLVPASGQGARSMHHRRRRAA